MVKKRTVLVEEEDTLLDKFQEYLRFKEYNGVCQKTIKTYRDKFKACFNGYELDTPISKVDWEIIISNIYNKPISEKSKSSYICDLSVFMRWLDNGIIIPKTRKIETIKDPYTDEEIKKLIRKPTSNSYVEYSTWCSILLLVDTGMRASSLRNLRREDVDLDHCAITLVHTKTRKVQVLPISKTTCKALRSLWKGTDDIYAISDAFGGKMSENCFRLRVERYNKSRGVSKTSIHLFRHFYAKHFIMNGGNAITLQKFLGHSTIAMSAHYCDLYAGDLKEVYISPVEELQHHRIDFKASNA